jgi:hypothetical protein
VIVLSKKKKNFLYHCHHLIINNSATSINYFTTTIHSAYGQAIERSSDSNNSANANSLNIQNIPLKKVHVGDIDIAYKVFGKGDHILLISGSGLVMVVLYGASCGGKENIPQSPEVVRILSDIVNNRLQDREKALSVSYPLSWIKSHHNITSPQSKEIVSPDTLKKQFNIVEDWFATNWNGVCSQLSKISVPTLVITGTEDIAVPAANSLIIAQKVPGSWLVQIKGAGHGLMYQYPDKLSKVLQTFLTTTTTIMPST